MMAVDRWRPYLSRGSFTIKTDHQSLCSLEDQVLTSDLQRKAMAKLVGLQFKFQFRKGVDNKVADALSRVGHAFALKGVSSSHPVWIQKVINSYVIDSEAQELLQKLAVTPEADPDFTLQKGLLRHQGRIWIGANSALQTKIIEAFHASPIGCHSGMQATYQRIKNLFHWSGLKQAVMKFVQRCQVCQQAKCEQCKYPGLPNPLPVPQGAWEDVTMDFVEGLPKSCGYSVIMVVVGRFTKYSHFCSLETPLHCCFCCPTVLAEYCQVAQHPLHYNI